MKPENLTLLEQETLAIVHWDIPGMLEPVPYQTERKTLWTHVERREFAQEFPDVAIGLRVVQYRTTYAPLASYIGYRDNGLVEIHVEDKLKLDPGGNDSDRTYYLMPGGVQVKSYNQQKHRWDQRWMNDEDRRHLKQTFERVDGRAFPQ